MIGKKSDSTGRDKSSASHRAGSAKSSAANKNNTKNAFDVDYELSAYETAVATSKSIYSAADAASPVAAAEVTPADIPSTTPQIDPNYLQFSGGNVEHNDLQRVADIVGRIEKIFVQRVVGQQQLWYAMMISMISGGHILIESVPGLAKTTAAQVLCQAVSGSFKRIQCTPDLMPSDIVGTQIYNYGTGEFTTQLGPVHANFVLLDEVNRSSAKTQSAMLEAMQEKQTTIGDATYPLPDQFMVIATQNPIEEEGTYVLPEAQMDRFLLKEVITYPTPDEEVEILKKQVEGAFDKPIDGMKTSIDDVKFMQEVVKNVYVSPAIIHYITSIVNTTRGGGPNPIVGLNKLVRVPASPRASIAFIKAAQALALLRNRAFVIPEDVKDLRYSVLRHRILRTFDAMAEDVLVESIIDQIFQVVPAP